jgi:hypothetical protein
MRVCLWVGQGFDSEIFAEALYFGKGCFEPRACFADASFIVSVERRAEMGSHLLEDREQAALKGVGLPPVYNFVETSKLAWRGEHDSWTIISRIANSKSGCNMNLTCSSMSSPPILGVFRLLLKISPS